MDEELSCSISCQYIISKVWKSTKFGTRGGKYYAAFRCEVLMKRLTLVCNQSIGTRKKNDKDSYSNDPDYGHIVDQNRQGYTTTFDTQKENQIVAPDANLWGIRADGALPISKIFGVTVIITDWKIRHLMSTICLVMHQQSRSLNIIKAFTISLKANVKSLSIIFLDVAIPATIDLLRYCLRNDTGKFNRGRGPWLWRACRKECHFEVYRNNREVVDQNSDQTNTVRWKPVIFRWIKLGCK